MEGLETNPRLGVNDKRILFRSLIAMTERLLMLNTFPVDMDEFALSLLDPAESAAWRLLREKQKKTIQKSDDFSFMHEATEFNLHLYPAKELKYMHDFMVFLRQDNHTNGIPILHTDNPYYKVVNKWCKKQLQLEQQVLRTIKVIKAIVHSCNTVGQYKRVSPELLTFLPDKYKVALKDYTKQSPYPAITVEPVEIDAALANLAFASLQPMHRSEEEYTEYHRPYASRAYELKKFPRTLEYDRNAVRRSQL